MSALFPECRVLEALSKYKRPRENPVADLLVDGGEVVVPEEDGQLPVAHLGVELTEAVVGELAGRLFQELLPHKRLQHSQL